MERIETWRKKVSTTGFEDGVYGAGPYGEGFYGNINTIQVEAVRLTEDNAEMVAAWCGGTLIEEIDPEHPEEMQPGINIRTAMGMKRASLHMYVIKYANTFFASHNRPFEMMYEPSNRPAPPLESAGDARRQRGFADPFDTGRMGI